MTTFDTRPIEVTDDPSSAHLSSVGAHGEATLAGWYDDPQQRHRMRYFSGSEWTQHVTHFGPTPCTGCHHTD